MSRCKYGHCYCRVETHRWRLQSSRSNVLLSTIWQQLSLEWDSNTRNGFHTEWLHLGSCRWQMPSPVSTSHRFELLGYRCSLWRRRWIQGNQIGSSQVRLLSELHTSTGFGNLRHSKHSSARNTRIGCSTSCSHTKRYLHNQLPKPVEKLKVKMLVGRMQPPSAVHAHDLGSSLVWPWQGIALASRQRPLQAISSGYSNACELCKYIRKARM